jgi:delta8-fatty-acid desaturase
MNAVTRPMGARWVSLFSTMLFFLRIDWYCTSGAFVGMFWFQLVFAAHDAGHVTITHHFATDFLIGMIIAAPIGSRFLGWWKRPHDVHHILTNAPAHDPDNQHLPVSAVNHRFLENIRFTYHERLLPYDDAAIPVPFSSLPVLPRPRSRTLQPQRLILEIPASKPRSAESIGLVTIRYCDLAGNLIFCYWFGYLIFYQSTPTPLSRSGFMMISHMINLPLHLQLTVSYLLCRQQIWDRLSLFPKDAWYDDGCGLSSMVAFLPRDLQFQDIHHLFLRIPSV